MPRAVSIRGLRKISDLLNLPREIQSATRVAGGIMKRAGDLVKAGSVAAVEATIGEAWHEAVADMAFSKDPYVAMRSTAFASITIGTDLVLLDFDFFKEQGLVANTTAQVEHNLLDDREVLKPVLVHNIGIDIAYKGQPKDLKNFVLASLDISRDKETIFEVPLMSCVKSMLLMDIADTAGSIPHIAVGEQAAGGLEIEGHGIPMVKSDKITVEVKWPVGTFTNHASVEGLIAMHLLMDGEVMGD